MTDIECSRSFKKSAWNQRRKCKQTKNHRIHHSLMKCWTFGKRHCLREWKSAQTKIQKRYLLGIQKQSTSFTASCTMRPRSKGFVRTSEIPVCSCWVRQRPGAAGLQILDCFSCCAILQGHPKHFFLLHPVFFSVFSRLRKKDDSFLGHYPGLVWTKDRSFLWEPITSKRRSVRHENEVFFWFSLRTFELRIQ